MLPQVEEYRRAYLVPESQAKGRTPPPDAHKACEYLLGSAIRQVVDTLGNNQCYVPNRYDPQPMTDELVRRQREMLRVLSKPQMTAR